MGKFFDEIPEFLFPWIKQQEAFWVATAPLNPDGHINVSPKGIRGCFHVVNANKVWYQDLSGSGIETISHIRENGRITILLNAFEGPPRIVRLFGKGTVHEFGTPEYNALIPFEERKPGSRSAIVIDVHKVGSSCGYSVPLYAFQAHRTKLLDYYQKKETADRADDHNNGLKAYWKLKNLKSIDGLEGLTTAPHLDDIPQSVYDREKEGMRVQSASTMISGDKRWNMGDLKFIVGLSLGMLISLIYSRVGAAI